MGKYQYPCLKQIDIFGIPPLFTIRGRPTFQTHIGSIITIICVTTILIYLIYLLTQMLCHKNPTFYSSIHYEEIPPEVKLSNNNFSFAFSLENFDYKNFIDNNVYNIKAFQTKLILQNDGSYKYQNTNLNIEKCNKITISYNYDKLPYDNLFCINDDIYLQGDYKTPIWNYVTFNFYKCENSTENNFSCKSENEINNLIKGGFIGMYISDYSFQPNNFDKPFKIFIKNLHRPFSIKYYKDIILYFKMVEIETDIGYFFEEKKKIVIPGFDYIQDDSKYEYENPNNFLSLNIKFSLKKEIHKRSYLKLQNIFSNVGGTMKLILLFGEYSVYFIRITLYKNYILEFFNLDESEIKLNEVRKIYKLNNKQKNKTMSRILNFKKYNPNYQNSSINNINNEGIKLRYNQNFLLNQTNLKNNNDKTIISSKTQKNLNENSENNNNNIKRLNSTKSAFDRIYIDNNKKEYEIKINEVSNIEDEKSKIKELNQDSFSKKQPSKEKYLSYQNYIQNNFFKDKALSKDSKYQVPTVVYFRNYFITKPKFNKPNRLTPSSKVKKVNSKTNNIIIPKYKLRIIKVPGFCSDFVCKKNSIRTIQQVHQNYKEIQFLLDIVHYLKSENEMNIIEKYLFTKEQRRILSHTYSFQADFALEKRGYDYMIKHKKNKLDEKSDRKLLPNNKKTLNENNNNNDNDDNNNNNNNNNY